MYVHQQPAYVAAVQEAADLKQRLASLQLKYNALLEANTTSSKAQDAFIQMSSDLNMHMRNPRASNEGPGSQLVSFNTPLVTRRICDFLCSALTKHPNKWYDAYDDAFFPPSNQRVTDNSTPLCICLPPCGQLRAWQKLPMFCNLRWCGVCGWLSVSLCSSLSLLSL